MEKVPIVIDNGSGMCKKTFIIYVVNAVSFMHSKIQIPDFNVISSIGNRFLIGKAGFAGDEAPISVFSCIVGRPRHKVWLL
jgi:hypothetical protein